MLFLENYSTEIRKHELELSVPRQSCFFDILPKLFKNSFGTKSKGEFLFAYFTPKISTALTDVTWNTRANFSLSYLMNIRFKTNLKVREMMKETRQDFDELLFLG